MKRHNVSSSKRVQRKKQLGATSSVKRKLMSCHLTKALRTQHKIRSLPIKRGDTVKILKGKAKGKEGKVVQVYRKRNVIYVDKVNRDKQNGQSVFLPIKPSYCVITSPILNKDRNKTIERKAAIKSKKMEKNKA
ncbi:MAG: 50S ribosomal protein L24 [archaeon]|nr:50S ribosomal protein L24 [archaeon]